MTDDIQGMTGDTKSYYLYTWKVEVRGMDRERFWYVSACGLRLCCWGKLRLLHMRTFWVRGGVRLKASLSERSEALLGNTFSFS